MKASDENRKEITRIKVTKKTDNHGFRDVSNAEMDTSLLTSIMHSHKGQTTRRTMPPAQ